MQLKTIASYSEFEIGYLAHDRLIDGSERKTHTPRITIGPRCMSRKSGRLGGTPIISHVYSKQRATFLGPAFNLCYIMDKAEIKNTELFRDYPMFWDRGHDDKYNTVKKNQALQKMVVKMQAYITDPQERLDFPGGIINGQSYDIINF